MHLRDTSLMKTIRGFSSRNIMDVLGSLVSVQTYQGYKRDRILNQKRPLSKGSSRTQPPSLSSLKCSLETYYLYHVYTVTDAYYRISAIIWQATENVAIRQMNKEIERLKKKGMHKPTHTRSCTHIVKRLLARTRTHTHARTNARTHMQRRGWFYLWIWGGPTVDGLRTRAGTLLWIATR